MLQAGRTWDSPTDLGSKAAEMRLATRVVDLSCGCSLSVCSSGRAGDTFRFSSGSLWPGCYLDIWWGWSLFEEGLFKQTAGLGPPHPSASDLFHLELAWESMNLCLCWPHETREDNNPFCAEVSHCPQLASPRYLPAMPFLSGVQGTLAKSIPVFSMEGKLSSQDRE